MSQYYQITEYLTLNPFLFLLLIAWVLTWKGIALWMSARREQKNWFLAILILNTLGILEIIYILYTRNKEKNNDIKEDEIKEKQPLI